jgi:C-terminal processing protease CtpA/Prc
LNKRQNLNQSDKLFVVVGRGTFSSAMLNTLTFQNKTNATFIGEPTGAKPNHYGQVQLLELRNTDSKVSYSVKYFERLSEDIESFIPDIIIEPNAEDYFNNIDSVMKTIIEYK